ncbi:MAG TPA: peroxidase-related enzyme [Puia sp.]|jgi:uncharacterized peroxidase-related enzyme
MHINIGNELPGIIGLFAYNPLTAKVLNDLAETLLRDESSPLSRGERELMAAFVSQQNNCTFCYKSHKAFAAVYLGNDLVEDILVNRQFKKLSPKMSSLFFIASVVANKGATLNENDIKAAKDDGATDKEIHDTVLISAAFCMYNRYVSGLGVANPDLTDEQYEDIARKITTTGYNHIP